MTSSNGQDVVPDGGVSQEQLDEIRAWHTANQHAMGRTALRCAAGCDGCVICHTDLLLREVKRLGDIIARK